MNDQFPGPLIQANWGDWIEIEIHNRITGPEDGTTIHLHGLRQYGTQYFDGAPGISQCPLAPGKRQTIRVRADAYGSSWWHSHYSAQYTAGIFGPMIIYGPRHIHYDFDLGPVMLGDWYHSNYTTVLTNVTSSSPDFDVYVPKSDNSLINGRNEFNCSTSAVNFDAPRKCGSNARLSRFRFRPSKTHLLRLMNTGAAALVHFSIDGHKMVVVSKDYTPLKPYEVDYITLGVAERVDILVKAPPKPLDSYWMRSTISLNCSAARNLYGKAIAVYKENQPTYLPQTNLSAAAATADLQPTLCKSVNTLLHAAHHSITSANNA